MRRGLRARSGLGATAARDGGSYDAGGSPDAGTDGAIPRDAGSDSGLDGGSDAGSDAGGSDAGGLCDPATMSCDGAGCSCAGGCACTLGCSENCTGTCAGDGTSCTLDSTGFSELDLVCTDGASCRVTARSASNVDRVVCENGASCRVDCEDVSNCFVSCRTGARCLLVCIGDTSNCRIDDCPGGATRCGSGRTYVCNRDCP